MTDILFIIGNSIYRRRYANCVILLISAAQGLLSRVTPRYFTGGFQGMGKFSKFNGDGVEWQRRLRMIALLLDVLILIFQSLHRVDNTFKRSCRLYVIASILRDSIYIVLSSVKRAILVRGHCNISDT